MINFQSIILVVKLFSYACAGDFSQEIIVKIDICLCDQIVIIYPNFMELIGLEVFADSSFSGDT